MTAVFEDITVNPETTRIDCFRYRDKEFNDVAFTVVQIEDKPYFLKGVVETQLFQLLGLTVDGIVGLPWESRIGAIKEAFTKPFVLKCADGYPYAVVTTGYTTVRHKLAWGWAQDMMNQRMLSCKLVGTLSSQRKLFARFVTYKDFNVPITEPNQGFYIFNSVRNTGSLSFGQSIYLPEYDVYLTGAPVYSIAHFGGLDKIEDEFKSAFLSLFFNFTMPNWNSLKQTPQQDLSAKLDELWYKYRQAMKRKLRPDMNQLDVIATIANVAQCAPAKTRLELEQIAFEEAFSELYN